MVSKSVALPTELPGQGTYSISPEHADVQIPAPVGGYDATGRGAELVVAHANTVIINDPGTAPDDFYSPHIGGGNFLMADGSVRFLRSTINLGVYRALCTRDQGEIISAHDY